MAIKYSWDYQDNSFTVDDKGVVKSIQAYLVGENQRGSHGICVLAELEAPSDKVIAFDDIDGKTADGWMDDFVAATPGLKLKYRSEIARQIDEKANAEAPAAGSTGKPASLT